MASTSNQFFYALTLRDHDAVTKAITGNFIGDHDKRSEQVVTAHGSILSVYDVHKDNGQLMLLHEQNVFGIIQQIASVQPAGSHKELLVVTSDSGRLVILEFDPAKRRWIQLHAETFGKSGLRRAIPGQYLAVDPRGRACMVASVEKFKLVYIFGRTQQEQITISSPLEANRPQNLLLCLIALDIGYDNPLFAALEVDYSEIEPKEGALPKPIESVEKLLVLYEVDLGTNHVMRKHAQVVERSANLIFSVPGGNFGPGGIFVCSEELITFINVSQQPLRIVIPRRKGATEDSRRKRIIVSGTLVKQRSVWFWLLQTDDGDIFRLDLESTQESSGVSYAQRLTLSYFDTIPVLKSSCVLRSGYLFSGSERGDNRIYMFQALGNAKEAWTSDDVPESGAYEPKYFQPRGLTNLLEITKPQSGIHPVIKTRVMNMTKEDRPQIYSACGSGANSSLNIQRHALRVTELSSNDLPNAPSNIFTVKMSVSDEIDKYIIVTYDNNNTLILSIGAEVEEDWNTGFRTDVQTLAVQQMGESVVVQIYPRGVRMVSDEPRWGELKYFEAWQPPAYRTIVACATNNKQVAVALSDGEIYYMQIGMNDELEFLNQEDDERTKMEGTVTAMGIGPVPPGREINPFLAVGCDDLTIHILSLDPNTPLETRALQALTAPPTSINIMLMPDAVSGGLATWLHVGLSSGTFIRTLLDENTGQLLDARTRFLGAKGVRLVPVSVNNEMCLLALSRSPWLGYIDPSTRQYQQTPLHYDTLTAAASLVTSSTEERIIATAGRSLRIFTIPAADAKMMIDSIPLMYTPRDFVRHPFLPLLYVIESEQNVLPPTLREQLKADAEAKGEEVVEMDPQQFGYPRAARYWASCIQIVDVVAGEVVNTIHMEDDQCLTSIAIPFIKSQDEHFVIVGTGKKLTTAPRTCEEGYIHVYRMWRPDEASFQEADGRTLEYIYNYRFDDAPTAITPFNGLFLFGVKNNLLAYDLGAHTMLRKAVCLRATPHHIVGIQREQNRIVCSDVKESVAMVVYKPQDNRLVRFTEDMVPRWVTAACFTDYLTAAGGDKFGNVFMLRTQPALSKEVDSDIPGAALTHERPYLGGTQNRLDLVMHYFVNDVPTSVQKTPLLAGGSPVLFWAGLQGTMGVFIPFHKREEVDFFMALEVKMREHAPSLVGRDHLSFRSYYAPVKGCVDGDLCEQYFSLDRNTKLIIAGLLDKTVRDVEKRLADARLRSAF